MTIGQILTAKEAAEQVRNSTIPMVDRFKIYPVDTAETQWMVWNHEEARRESDRDGAEVFSQRDAHDLAEELRHS